jgi:hypothetical protein
MAGIVIGGLLLLRASISGRIVAVGCGVLALTVLAVFTPSCARSVVNNATAGAVFAVLVVWGMWYVAVTRPRDPDIAARRAARRAARAEERRARRPPSLPEGGAPPPTPTAGQKESVS